MRSITNESADQAPPRSALSTFISLAGDRDVGTYSREDAKLFVHHLQLKGNKTATIRRRDEHVKAHPAVPELSNQFDQQQQANRHQDQQEPVAGDVVTHRDQQHRGRW